METGWQKGEGDTSHNCVCVCVCVCSSGKTKFIHFVRLFATLNQSLVNFKTTLVYCM